MSVRGKREQAADGPFGKRGDCRSARIFGKVATPLGQWGRDPVIPSAMQTIFDTVPKLTQAFQFQHMLEGDKVTGEERLMQGEGRIRDITQAPDGALYVPVDDAGKVLRVTPKS